MNSEQATKDRGVDEQTKRLPPCYSAPHLTGFGELRALIRGAASPNKVDAIGPTNCPDGDETTVAEAGFC